MADFEQYIIRVMLETERLGPYMMSHSISQVTIGRECQLSAHIHRMDVYYLFCVIFRELTQLHLEFVTLLF